MWNNDMSTAPKSFEVIWLYFPLEGLDKGWQRVVACWWNWEICGWVFNKRSYRGYSRDYQPTHWQPYKEEAPEPPNEI